MKKIYLKPATEELMVDMQTLLGAGSLTINGESGTATVYQEELGEDDVVLSRHNDLWDDALDDF